MKKIITLLCCFFSITVFSQIRISQVYAGGGNTNATYNQDFVEIFNGTTEAANLTNWSIQYAPATGPGGNGDWDVAVIPPGTIVGAGQYYLVGLSTGATGATLPAPDLINSSINLSATAGKIAFTSGAMPLNGINACSTSDVVDIVGYGSTASCYRTSPVVITGLDNTKSLLRANAGCTDAGNNSTDFAVAPVTPRNSASPANICLPDPVLNVSWVSGLTTTIGLASSPQSLVVAGTGLTGFPGNITVTVAGTNFEVSLNNTSGFGSSVNIPYTSGTLGNTMVFLRISATAPPGDINALITVGGGGAVDATFTTAGNVVTAEPTTQATDILATNITETGMDINWTNGNGTARLVLITPSAIIQSEPLDGSIYTAATDITMAGTIGVRNYVVFSGSGSGPISITGLEVGTTYEVRVFEYNGSAGSINYLSSVTFTNPVLVTTTGISNKLTEINFTSVATPQYMGSGGDKRTPTLFYARVSNLSPNTTYRYFIQAGVATDLGTTNSGAGNSLLIDYTVSPVIYTYCSAPSLNSPGGYGKFRTDGTGNFTGSFGFVNTGNQRFDAGSPNSSVIPTITLSTEQATNTVYRFALNQAINLLGFTSTVTFNRGSFIKGGSSASPGNIVGLWNNTTAAGRPLSMTLVEKPTIVTGNGGDAWHSNFIAGYDSANGSWNTVVPNSNASGVRLIQTFDIVSGKVLGCSADVDGTWPTGAVNTSSPTNGATPLAIAAADAPLNPGSSCFDVLPVRLDYIKGQKTGNGIVLNWKIACLSTSVTMEITRSADGRNFKPVTSITATQARCDQPFDFTDWQPFPGKNYYRLKMIDIDGKRSYSPVVLVINAIKGTEFGGLYPSIVKNTMSLGVSAAKATAVETRITDLSGRLIKSYKQAIPAGSSLIKIDCTGLAAGVYNLTGIAEDAAVKTIRFVKQ